MHMRKSATMMKALAATLLGIGVCSCSTGRTSAIADSTFKADSVVYYAYGEDHPFKRITLNALKRKARKCSYEKDNRREKWYKDTTSPGA